MPDPKHNSEAMLRSMLLQHKYVDSLPPDPDGWIPGSRIDETQNHLDAVAAQVREELRKQYKERMGSEMPVVKDIPTYPERRAQEFRQASQGVSRKTTHDVNLPVEKR